MKGFALDDKGDLVIENNEIAIVVGDALTQQNARTVLQTSVREWFFDWTQGLNRENILGKGITEELVRYEIENGLKQVNENLAITSFSFDVDKAARRAKVTFVAQTEDGTVIGGDYSWD